LQLLRGLPFQLGTQPGEGACLLGFGEKGYIDKVEIPIHQKAG
jgi:hypothetical protein